MIDKIEVLNIEEAFRLRALLKKVECRSERSVIDGILRGEYDRLEDALVIAYEDLSFLKEQINT